MSPLSRLARSLGKCPSCAVTLRWSDKVSTDAEIVERAPPKVPGLDTAQCVVCVGKIRRLLGASVAR